MKDNLSYLDKNGAGFKGPRRRQPTCDKGTRKDNNIRGRMDYTNYSCSPYKRWRQCLSNVDRSV